MSATGMSYWHDDPATHPPIGTWMWHLHHEVLCEPLTVLLANRLAYIRRFKPESQQDTRLRLIDIVRGELPPAYVEAWAAYVEATPAASPALEALHAVEHPDCPWNGRSIFGTPA